MLHFCVKDGNNLTQKRGDLMNEYRERRLNDYRGYKITKIQDRNGTDYLAADQDDNLFNVDKNLATLKRCIDEHLG